MTVRRPMTARGPGPLRPRRPARHRLRQRGRESAGHTAPGTGGDDVAGDDVAGDDVAGDAPREQEMPDVVEELDLERLEELTRPDG